MIQLRSFAILVVACASLSFALPTQAQSSEYTLGLVGGIGGTEDTGNYNQTNLQALFAFEWAPRTLFVVRAGQMELDGESGTLPEGDLRWLTLSTEYRLPAGFYQSGLFIGIGYYNLESTGGFLDDSAFGLNLGVTGDIPVTRHFSILVEVSGHYADLDSTQLLLMAQGGLAFHF